MTSTPEKVIPIKTKRKTVGKNKNKNKQFYCKPNGIRPMKREWTIYYIDKMRTIYSMKKKKKP